MTDFLPLRPALLGAALASVVLSGCAIAGPADVTSAPSTSASSAGDSAAARPAVAPSGTTVPSVAPGTVLNPKDFVAELRGAMKTAKNYEFTTTSAISDPGAPKTAPTTHTTVDQSDPSTTKVRTETTSNNVTTTLILIGDTQYLRSGDGKFQRSTVPPQAGQGLVEVGLDVENGARSVTYVGPDNVDGQLARHYTADMPAQGAGQSGQSADPSGEHMSYDLWLDAQGRVLKVVTVMTTLTTTQQYSNYDSAPAVVAPDPSDVQS